MPQLEGLLVRHFVTAKDEEVLLISDDVFLHYVHGKLPPQYAPSRPPSIVIFKIASEIEICCARARLHLASTARLSRRVTL